MVAGPCREYRSCRGLPPGDRARLRNGRSVVLSQRLTRGCGRFRDRTRPAECGTALDISLTRSARDSAGVCCHSSSTARRRRLPRTYWRSPLDAPSRPREPSGSATEQHRTNLAGELRDGAVSAVRPGGGRRPGERETPRDTRRQARPSPQRTLPLPCPGRSGHDGATCRWSGRCSRVHRRPRRPCARPRSDRARDAETPG